jgi:hypothetical protein
MTPVTRLLASGLFLHVMLAAADVTGIWMGQVTARGGEKQDLAFQFKQVKGLLTGVMFGDEFDLPVEDLNISGDTITFTVATTNYYDGRKNKFAYTGTIGEKELQLTRERKGGQSPPPANGKGPDQKQVIRLIKLT